jgi:hypothetical protein
VNYINFQAKFEGLAIPKDPNLFRISPESAAGVEEK